MLESPYSKEIIAYRREAKKLERDGYRRIEGHWYGPQWDERITDAKVVQGRSVFVKIESKPSPSQTPSQHSDKE